jgi:hypothetical protein
MSRDAITGTDATDLIAVAARRALVGEEVLVVTCDAREHLRIDWRAGARVSRAVGRGRVEYPSGGRLTFVPPGRGVQGWQPAAVLDLAGGDETVEYLIHCGAERIAPPAAEPPPVARYRYTLTVTGNTLDEIHDEIRTDAHGGFILSTEHMTRHEFESTGGRETSKLEQVNPDMTPEKYAADLDAWWTARKGARAVESLSP